MANSRVKFAGQPCDVTIIAGTRRIDAHKSLLASGCPYFNCMFKEGFIESTGNIVTIKQVDEDIELRCIKYLKDNLDADNCLGILEKARHYQLVDLSESAFLYCLRHFMEVAQSGELPFLSLETLIEIVSSDNLEVTCEHVVEKAIMRWIKHNICDRQAYLDTLMEHVRLNPQYLTYHTIVDKCRQVMSHLTYWMKLTSHPATPANEVASLTKAKLTPRWPRNRLYSLKCYANVMATYNPITDEWRDIEPKAKNKIGGLSELVALEGRLYVFNLGSDRSIQFYDPSAGKWNSNLRPPPKDIRIYPAYVALDGLLYMMDDIDSTRLHRYDPRYDTWTEYQTLESGAWVSSLATLDGCIYALGGRSVGRLDPRLDKWHRVAPMTTWKWVQGCASLNGCLYAIGQHESLNSGEKYEPRTNSWCPIAQLAVNRHRLYVAALDGLIYTVSQDHSLFEAYDPITNDIIRFGWSYRAPLVITGWSCFKKRSGLVAITHWLSKLVLQIARP